MSLLSSSRFGHLLAGVLLPSAPFLLLSSRSLGESLRDKSSSSFLNVHTVKLTVFSAFVLLLSVSLVTLGNEKTLDFLLATTLKTALAVAIFGMLKQLLTQIERRIPLRQIFFRRSDPFEVLFFYGTLLYCQLCSDLLLTNKYILLKSSYPSLPNIFLFSTFKQFPRQISTLALLATISLVLAFGLLVVTSEPFYFSLLLFDELKRNVRHGINNRLPNINQRLVHMKTALRSRYDFVKAYFIFETEHPEGTINILINRYLFLTPERTLCEICLTKKSKKRVPKLSSCSHRVCIRCLQNYIETEGNNAEGTQLLCPFDPNVCFPIDATSINSVLDSFDPFIQNKNLKEKLEKSYLRKALVEMHSVMHCPAPNCKNIQFSDEALLDENYLTPKKPEVNENNEEAYEKVTSWVKTPENWSKIQITKKKNLIKELSTKYKVNENGVDLRMFKCSTCHYTSCVICKSLFTHGSVSHSQLTCEEYHEARLDFLNDSEESDNRLTEEEIERNVKKGLMKHCPKCATLIEKNGGCPHMTCKKCKFEWCWGCLNAYGSCQC